MLKNRPPVDPSSVQGNAPDAALGISSAIDYDSERILRRSDLLKRLAMSDAYLHALINRWLYPQPFALGSKARGWLESANDAWITSRMLARPEHLRPQDPVTLPLWTPEMELIEPPRRGLTLMRLGDVVFRVGMGRTAISEWVLAGLFPAPIAIGIRARAWVYYEVSDWIRERHERKCDEDPAYGFLTQRLDSVRPQTRSSVQASSSRRPRAPQSSGKKKCGTSNGFG